MPRKASNRQIQIEVSPDQYDVIMDWKRKRNARSAAALIREAIAAAMQNDGVVLPDDLGEWGDPDRLRSDDHD